MLFPELPKLRKAGFTVPGHGQPQGNVRPHWVSLGGLMCEENHVPCKLMHFNSVPLFNIPGFQMVPHDGDTREKRKPAYLRRVMLNPPHTSLASPQTFI